MEVLEDLEGDKGCRDVKTIDNIIVRGEETAMCFWHSTIYSRTILCNNIK